MPNHTLATHQCVTALVRDIIGIAMGFLILSVTTPLQAQQFPSRPIRLVVPFPAGATTDVIARMVGQRAGDRLGKRIVVDNRPGASGTIGVEIVAHAAPDGYTWGLGTTTTHALARVLNPQLAYDPVRDFAPVALLGETPYFLTTNPALPVTDFNTFVAYARANPGKILYASVGNLSLGHLAAELLKRTGRFDMVHVPYKGSNLPLIDLLANRIQLNVSTIVASLPYVRSGKLRALAVTSRGRNSILPQTPSVAESGFPDYQAMLWMGVFLPTRAPATVVGRINRELISTLRATDLREALAEQAFAPAELSMAAFTKLMHDDIARWGKVIADAGLKSE